MQRITLVNILKSKLAGTMLQFHCCGMRGKRGGNEVSER